jgi:hypothetical protein
MAAGHRLDPAAVGLRGVRAGAEGVRWMTGDRMPTTTGPTGRPLACRNCKGPGPSSPATRSRGRQWSEPQMGSAGGTAGSTAAGSDLGKQSSGRRADPGLARSSTAGDSSKVRTRLVGSASNGGLASWTARVHRPVLAWSWKRRMTAASRRRRPGPPGVRRPAFADRNSGPTGPLSDRSGGVLFCPRAVAERPKAEHAA